MAIYLEVSIRSPRRSEGRLGTRQVVCLGCDVFQSAPPAEARGDSSPLELICCAVLFQSAPPAEARGDLSPPVVAISGFLCFNPLPPPKRGEMPSNTTRTDGRAVFQSAPPAEARGDPTWRTAARPSRCFNPLPPPKRGEIEFLAGFLAFVLVSIRSPRRSEGRYGVHSPDG